MSDENEKGEGMAIIFVGATDHGKTKYGVFPILEELPDMPKLIFDPSPKKQYEKKFQCNFAVDKNKDVDEQVEAFCVEAKKREGHVIVIEDATAFFSNKGSSKLMNNLLVFKVHRNQIIILVFHSLRAIPVEIMDNINTLVIRKTGDRPSLIEQRYGDWPEVYDAFVRVNENIDKYYFEEVLINL